MSKSASSTLYAFGLNSYITPCVADAILINSEDIGQLWIFGPRGPSRSPCGPWWEGPGGTPGTQPGPMLWPYPPSSTSMGSQWAVLQHGLTKGVLTRDSSRCPHGTLHPRAIPGTLPWRVKFGTAQIAETFVLMVFKGLDGHKSSWVQHTQRRASNSS